MDTEITLKAGDVCLDCQQQLGIEKRLRYFKINLNGDTLLKCESNECMYPYNDEMYSTDEEHEEENDQSLKFLDDFIQQYNNETAAQDSRNDMPNSSENVTTHFDISFLDNFNENLCKTEISQDSNEFLDSKTNIEIIKNEFITLPQNSKEIQSAVKDKIFENSLESLPIFISLVGDTKSSVIEENSNQLSSFISCKDYKPKIDIQSIETIDIESPLYNILPTSSKKLTEISSVSSNEPSQLTKSLKYSNSNLPTSVTCTEIPSTSSSAKTVTSKLSSCSLEKPKSLELSHSNKTTSTTASKLSSTSSQAPKSQELLTTLNSPQSSDISLKSITPAVAQKSTEENLTTLSVNSIPKANIMKGRDILKKLAIVDEKMSKQNFKSIRKKKKIANKEEIKNEEKPLPSFSGDMDYSLEKISQMLSANRMKRQNNN
ncbi:uncharacterized protein LOC119613591 [Lucilia sericata]|uniref:uncharacterized protein LOC119613591 n=1 Tax=Lucilia sericata TaxID=13632 RepID=UPI0018A86634|nr:uncharacterized protein LOC119613591 [Lucilia sericata]